MWGLLEDPRAVDKKLRATIGKKVTNSTTLQRMLAIAESGKPTLQST